MSSCCGESVVLVLRRDFGPRRLGVLLGRWGLDFSTIALDRHSRKTW